MWLLLQIIHDVSVFVPGRYKAEVSDSCRHPIERENIIVLEPFHHRHCRGKLLRHSSGQWRTTLWGIARRAYRSECQCVRILIRHLEDPERDFLAFIPTLPDFDHLGDVLGMASLPYDTLKFVMGTPLLKPDTF